MVHAVWQPSALETLNSQECLSRGELCQAPSIHFNTCVSWRFQNGLITVSNCSGIPRETGRLDLERPEEFREGSVHSGETTPLRELTRRVCYLPFPFWQTLAAFGITFLSDCGNIDNLGENLNTWLAFSPGYSPFLRFSACICMRGSF